MQEHIRDEILDGLEIREGYRRFAYKDSLGKLTIGHGTMIEKGGYGVPKHIARELAKLALEETVAELIKVDPWIADLPEPAQLALYEMCYQLGAPKLRGFKKMLAACQEHDWFRAISEAHDSRWAKQTPVRYEHVMKLFMECV